MEGSQCEQAELLRLPLHPRRTQELFFKASDAPSTPPRPFQQRVLLTQQFCADAFKLLQRGQWVRDASKHPREPLVQLRLSRNGAKLQLFEFTASPPTTDTAEAKAEADQETETDDEFALTLVEEVDFVAIRHLVLLPHTSMCFRISTTERTARGSAFQSLQLEAESELVLAKIAIAIASGVTAAERGDDAPAKSEGLLWQAVRLRVVELSASMTLREAVVKMESAYTAIAAREAKSELPPLLQLFFLLAGSAA